MPDIDKSNTEIQYIVDGSGPDGTFKEGDDIREDTRKTLANFLHCLSKNENKQVIKPNMVTTALGDAQGNPAALDLQVRGSTNPHAATSKTPEIADYSDSGDIFFPTVRTFLRKGEDGNKVLKNITGVTDRSGKNTSPVPNKNKIVEQVSTALENNRFSPGPKDSPYVEGGNRPNTIAGEQGEFGAYNPDGPGITLNQLQDVGFSLMLRAAGELKAATDGDPNSGLAGLASLVPGKAQLAVVRIPTNEMEAASAFGAPEKIGLNIPTSGGSRSFGVLNTHLEPFDGFLPIGMTILGMALVIALRLVTRGFLLLMSLIVRPSSDKSLAPVHGPFIVGEFGKPDPPSRLISLSALGIINTDRDFVTVVNAGLDVFFEFNGRDFRRVVRNPGFYTVFVRNVIRSGNIIINKIADAFKPGQNPLAVAQGVLGIIDVLRTSKIIAFLNILAQLGERALDLENLGFTDKSKKISQVENLPDNAVTHVMKIREGRSRLRSAYRNSSVASRFLFPAQALLASDLLATGAGAARLDEAMAGIPEGQLEVNDAISRIDPATLAEVEAELDAEYVPFYFHDLRTNEIVGFHAFLDSLEDSYSPNWEETSAYGRVDDVGTYKNTKRQVNFTFNILATSKTDFDVMWWKINKLTTMVYPQWSEGRQVADPVSGKKFIQPFSQVPTASPLIRVRIGDIIKNNFSRFALGRIFGFGSDKNTIVENTTTPDLDRFAMIALRTRMETNPAISGKNEDGFRSGEFAVLISKTHGGYVESVSSLALPLPPIFAAADKKRLILTADTRVRIVRGPADDPGLAIHQGEHELAQYVIEVAPPAGDADEFQGKFLCTFEDLYPDVREIASQVRGLDASVVNDLQDQVDVAGAEFMHPSNNAISRAFDSVKGKGLGGWVSSMTFTDLASPSVLWETADFGSRAPKMIKVNISFNVVHDIPPGLSSDGFTRAVNYPVGKIAGKVGGDTYDEEERSLDTFTRQHTKAAGSFRKPDRKD